MTTKIEEFHPAHAWIAMSLAPGFGSHSFRIWLEQSPVQSHTCDLLALRHLEPWDRAGDILAQCTQHGIRAIGWDEADYPAILRSSLAALPVLYTQGQLPSQRSKSIAMVGTRTPSWNGKACARALVEALQGQETSVISGLANGIDLACHRAALEFKVHTVAVLAQGLDQRIPGERGVVARNILEMGGALVSPFPPGVVAYPGHFLARNGIIAGLSVATIVVESRSQGGALNTAEHCMADSRLLLAVPGDILRDVAQGPNMLCESKEAQPLWLPFQLPLLAGLDAAKNPNSDSGSRSEFETSFAGETCTLEEILDRSELPLTDLLQTLGVLEMEGKVAMPRQGLYQFPKRMPQVTLASGAQARV
jgi:DNA processing protein